MLTGIAMSLGMRQSLAAYQSMSAQIDAIQARLATGKRVNSALDDPAAFFTSSSLNARAVNINSLMDNISNAKNTIQAAINGASAIRSLLVSAQNLVNSAVASANTLVKVTGASTPVLTAGTVIASNTGSSTKLKSGDTITVNDGTTTATYTAVNNNTVQTILDAINNTAGLKVTASLNGSGQIVLQATETNNITIGGTFSGTGTLVGVTGLTAGTTTFTANSTRTSYALQFDAIRSQIDALAQDAGFSDLNLLTGGSKSVAFNETGTSSFTLSGVAVSSSGLGVAASTNQFQIDSDIATAVANIAAALSSLDNQAATYGNDLSIIDARSQFNQDMIDTLATGADDLVLSDANADGAMLLALQTRQKLAATTMSMASDSATMALRLFGLA